MGASLPRVLAASDFLEKRYEFVSLPFLKEEVVMPPGNNPDMPWR
jgi:hypothetical protein